jgi:hypothetical protein
LKRPFVFVLERLVEACPSFDASPGDGTTPPSARAFIDA